jgi:hypothetical protein
LRCVLRRQCGYKSRAAECEEGEDSVSFHCWLFSLVEIVTESQ